VTEPHREIWFAYRLRGGRLKAWPVNLSGWIVLAAVVGGPVIGMNLLAPRLVARFGQNGVLIGLAGVFLLVFPTIFYLVRAKGRRVD
jgi:uncharacterized membrane protein